MADHLPTTSRPAPARVAQWTDARKFLVHLLVPLLALALAARDGLTALEALQVLVLLSGSAAVYIVRNGLSGPWQYTKAIAAWVAVVAAAAVPYALNGWGGLLVGAPAVIAAAAGALGVGVVPNTGTTTLADAMADILEQLHQVRTALPAAPDPHGAAPAERARQTFAERPSEAQVRGAHAPAPVITRIDEAEQRDPGEQPGLTTEQISAVTGRRPGSFL